MYYFMSSGQSGAKSTYIRSQTLDFSQNFLIDIDIFVAVLLGTHDRRLR